MREIRAFVDAPLRPGSELELPEAASEHLLRVLRLPVGSPVTLFNGLGGEYRATLVSATRHAAHARIEAYVAIERESPLRITLLQAMARGEKMDWVLQKATELGVAVIQPVAAERSVVQLDGDRAGRRHEHWLGIVRSACEQCGRNRLPELRPPRELAAATATARGAEPHAAALLLSPTAERPLAALLQPGLGAVQLLVGPEGGFSEGELRQAEAAGFTAVRCGPRVLRTETAAIALISALQAAHGDLAL